MIAKKKGQNSKVINQGKGDGIRTTRTHDLLEKRRTKRRICGEKRKTFAIKNFWKGMGKKVLTAKKRHAGKRKSRDSKEGVTHPPHPGEQNGSMRMRGKRD